MSTASLRKLTVVFEYNVSLVKLSIVILNPTVKSLYTFTSTPPPLADALEPVLTKET